MITIKLQNESYEFPDASFSDLEVVTACRNMGMISEEYMKAYPDGSDIDAVLDFLQDYGNQLIEQIDVALGDGACLKMFGSRMNIEKLRACAEQLIAGMVQAWGGTAAPAKSQKPVYSKKTGKHKDAYRKPQPKVQDDVFQKTKHMSKDEKAALLAAWLE